LTNYKDAYAKADIIVFLVAHSVFKTLLYDDNKVILDFCGIYKKQLSRSPL
ncbi:nucleotide sugar dehydrogenase domain protein, partial [Bacteroides fragilis str. 3397 T10]